MDVLEALVYKNTMLDTDILGMDNANIIKAIKLWKL